MRATDCHNTDDFRRLARRRLPRPIFDYIDGGADDEVTLRRNAAAFADCDLVPNVLRGVGKVDTSVTVMGQRLGVPFYCSPTALQRLFHHEGERAVARAAAGIGTMFGVSTVGTVAIEEIRAISTGPQVYQFYYHKDRGLNRALIDRAKAAGVDVLMLTVDASTGGNRERDKRTGFAIPFQLNAAGLLGFAAKPVWAFNHFTHEPFALPQLSGLIEPGSATISISRYFSEMLDAAITWDDVRELKEHWGGTFCLKGVMAAEDAVRAAEIGCDGVVVSNHGGRQLDGSRTAFDQLAEVVDAVAGRIDVLMDGGVTRGSHVLKALAMGAKAVGIGRAYLFPLAAGGTAGVERALELLRDEIERDMKLMGVRSLDELSRAHLRFRIA